MILTDFAGVTGLVGVTGLAGVAGFAGVIGLSDYYLGDYGVVRFLVHYICLDNLGHIFSRVSWFSII